MTLKVERLVYGTAIAVGVVCKLWILGLLVAFYTHDYRSGYLAWLLIVNGMAAIPQLIIRRKRDKAEMRRQLSRY